jgi:hypothetical protein
MPKLAWNVIHLFMFPMELGWLGPAIGWDGISHTVHPEWPSTVILIFTWVTKITDSNHHNGNFCFGNMCSELRPSCLLHRCSYRLTHMASPLLNSVKENFTIVIELGINLVTRELHVFFWINDIYTLSSLSHAGFLISPLPTCIITMANIQCACTHEVAFPSLKTRLAGGMVHTVEHLPSECEAPS